MAENYDPAPPADAASDNPPLAASFDLQDRETDEALNAFYGRWFADGDDEC